MKMGIDTSLTYQNLDVFGAMDFAAGLGSETVMLHRNQLRDYEQGHMRAVKEHADRLGLSLEYGMGCIDRHASTFKAALGTAEEQLRAGILASKALGSPAVQVFIGNLYNRLWYAPFEQRLADAADVIRAVKPLIEETGIRVAIENHGDSTARELAALIDDIGPDYAGVCLDTGNPVVLAEDPLLTVEVLAPYTLMTAFRDNLVWEVEDGAMAQWVQMGAGNTNLPQMVALLREHAPHASFTLELITGGAPKRVPYLDPQAEVWQKVPHTPAPDFARFVALAKKGPVGPVEMVWRPEPPGQEKPSPELAAALKEQQRRHLAESLAYCRDVLGVGEKR
jgi:3-oxoisoapionate decarboxylase